MEDKLLSVIIPVYNEKNSLEELLNTVFKTPILKEIIVVNDGSTDGSREILEDFEKKKESFYSPTVKNFQVVHKPKNEGKGAAIRTGLRHVAGDIVIIQDADLELNPQEYPNLLKPFNELNADVVFGSRFRKEGVMRVHNFWHYIGNRVLTQFSNIMSGLYITDMETCYKVFKREVILSFALKSKRFGIEPELTARVARLARRGEIEFYEVPISYRPRTKIEGKKISVKDGLIALFSIIYFNIFI